MSLEKVTFFFKKYSLLCVLFCIMQSTFAQIGGQSTYSFLSIENSARIAAMGGKPLAIMDNDISLTLSNPSLISPELDGKMAFSFVDYFSDVNYGFVSYAKSFRRLGSFVGTVQYINYGTFMYANESGVQQGTFGASEFALIVGWSRLLNHRFKLGVNAKFIYSSLESYNSYGLAVDLAASYSAPRSDFVASLMLHHLGRQIKTYRSGVLEPLPFEISMAMSNKLKHVPFRYSLALSHMEKWDLTYRNPLLDNSSLNQDVDSTPSVSEKMMSHLILGGEILFSESFVLRFGYNYRRRQEMKVDSKISTVGFSWGFGVKIDKFEFNYARSNYHLVGSPNYLTLIVKLSDF